MNSDAQSEIIVGIDLGTTNSLISIFKNNQTILINNSLNEYLTPSVIGLLKKEDQIIVGEPANSLEVTSPENCSRNFKRLMGLDYEINLAKKSFMAHELSSLVLKSLKEDAEEFFKHSIKRAVITVPAYFNDHQRQATKMAGELAGFKVERIINEPTAAALSYGFHEKEADKKIVVFDLGGGTFDVTVMEIFEGSLEIISTAGIHDLGGEDFTRGILSWVLKRNNMQFELEELRHPLRISRLRNECENVKKKLNEKNELEIRFPNEDGSFSDDTMKITKDIFQLISDNLIRKLDAPLNKVIRDSGILKEDIDDVILVGGATRMDCIKEYVETFFGKSALCELDPDKVVAFGAAIQGALISDDKDVEDMVMTDVCPHSLGISICKEWGNQLQDGYFLPVIHRGTTIPVSREETVYTLFDNQPSLLVEVFQGESRKTKGNLKLGDFSIDNLPLKKAGMEINVRFTYDLNGLLEIEVIVPETQKRKKVLIKNNVKGLSEKDMKDAILKLQKLKFYPRDHLPNRNLLLFAEKCLEEVPPLERTNLEEEIDIFEASMSANNEEFFNEAKKNILVKLSSLGFPYQQKPWDNNDS
ncbi:MAG: molecular chaperone HscC [Planctomycetota bacterium]|nr:MAG: molecular chaperone HscC [Planctomycetota bacterium]